MNFDKVLARIKALIPKTRGDEAGRRRLSQLRRKTLAQRDEAGHFRNLDETDARHEREKPKRKLRRKIARASRKRNRKR